MRNRYRPGLVSACLLFSGLASAERSAGTADEAAARWFKDSYVADFLSDDPNFMDHYADSVQFIIGQKVETLGRDALAAAMDKIYVQPWIAAGWETTRLLGVEATSLASDTVHLTADWGFLDSAGNNVVGCERPQWHYLVVFNGTRWQINAEIEGGCAATE